MSKSCRSAGVPRQCRGARCSRSREHGQTVCARSCPQRSPAARSDVAGAFPEYRIAALQIVVASSSRGYHSSFCSGLQNLASSSFWRHPRYVRHCAELRHKRSFDWLSPVYGDTCGRSPGMKDWRSAPLRWQDMAAVQLQPMALVEVMCYRIRQITATALRSAPAFRLRILGNDTVRVSAGTTSSIRNPGARRPACIWQRWSAEVGARQLLKPLSDLSVENVRDT